MATGHNRMFFKCERFQGIIKLCHATKHRILSDKYFDYFPPEYTFTCAELLNNVHKFGTPS